MWVQPLGKEDSPEKGMATHFTFLAWRIAWTEKPGGLQSIRSQRVRHNWSDLEQIKWINRQLKLMVLSFFLIKHHLGWFSFTKTMLVISNHNLIWYFISSVQFSHSVMSDSLLPHESQHARPPCPSPAPRVYSNPCPSSRWCHPAISSSVVPFSSCPQSLPASGSFPISQLFSSGGQSIGVSASASVLPMNTQDWSPLGWTGWTPLQSKGLSRVFSNTTVQKHQFFGAQLSSQSNSHIQTWPLKKPQPWLDGPLLIK